MVWCRWCGVGGVGEGGDVGVSGDVGVMYV